MEVAVMAKKKPGPKPKPQGTRSSLLAVKCRPEWKEYVEEFSREERVTPSHLVDRAIAALAREMKRKAPPER